MIIIINKPRYVKHNMKKTFYFVKNNVSFVKISVETVQK